MWEFVGRALAEQGFRVLAPDLRGHGESGRGTYSVDEYVEDLLESVPQRPALAIGHSMGGVVLLEAAARLRPLRAVYEDPAWPVLGGSEARIVEFESRKQTSREAIAQSNPRWTPDEVTARHEGFGRWDEATARSFILGRGDHTPSGPPLQPSLVVLAEGSPFVPEPTIQSLRRAGWEVRTIPSTGHYVHLDDRAAFLACVSDWMN